MPEDKSPLDTRERIINFLRQNQTSTVPELSKLWGLTRRDIRYHIQILIKEGIVEQVSATEIQHTTQRGRPIIMYRLNISNDEDNYQSLCQHLLTLIFENKGFLTSEETIRSLAKIFAREQVRQPGPISNQFNQAVKFLNTNHYRARWEAGAAGPRIFFHNCPYAALLPENPMLCQLDRAILEQLLGYSFVQTNKIILKNSLPGYCIFRISSFASEP